LVLFFVLELLFFDIVVCYKFVTSSLILSLFVVLCAWCFLVFFLFFIMGVLWFCFLNLFFFLCSWSYSSILVLLFVLCSCVLGFLVLC
jgi:hypothetical protein